MKIVKKKMWLFIFDNPLDGNNLLLSEEKPLKAIDKDGVVKWLPRFGDYLLVASSRTKLMKNWTLADCQEVEIHILADKVKCNYLLNTKTKSSRKTTKKRSKRTKQEKSSRNPENSKKSNPFIEATRVVKEKKRSTIRKIVMSKLKNIMRS
jgi:hypothetical protein